MTNTAFCRRTIDLTVKSHRPDGTLERRGHRRSLHLRRPRFFLGSPVSLAGRCTACRCGVHVGRVVDAVRHAEHRRRNSARGDAGVAGMFGGIYDGAKYVPLHSPRIRSRDSSAAKPLLDIKQALRSLRQHDGLPSPASYTPVNLPDVLGGSAYVGYAGGAVLESHLYFVPNQSEVPDGSVFGNNTFVRYNMNGAMNSAVSYDVFQLNATGVGSYKAATTDGKHVYYAPANGSRVLMFPTPRCN